MTVHNLTYRILYQLPTHASTFSLCPKCGVGSARGGDVCIDCLTEQLAESVGKEKAVTYVKSLKETRKLEAELYD